MNILERIFPSTTASLRPRLACEITLAGVVAARPGTSKQDIVSAFVSLRPGVLSPGLKAPIFTDRAAVVSALRQVLDEVSLRDTKVTLVIPDASVRVLLLDFDNLPAKAAEVLPLIRFRLRKLVPFEVEDAAVTYQVTTGKNDLVRVIVAVTPAATLAEYENAVREAGYEPGAVLPSTLAALAAVEAEEPSLVVNRNGDSVTTAITKKDELLLHRTLDLASHHSSLKDFERGDLVAEVPWRDSNRDSTEDLQQSVSVAIAYFEDTLAVPPQQLLACGMGGAHDLAELLGNVGIPTHDLVSNPAIGNSTAIPRGVLAGVVGALAS